MRKGRLCAAAAIVLCATLAPGAVDTIIVGAFSAVRPGAALPDGWVPLGADSAKNRTRYALVDDGGATVLRAESNAAASGLSRKLRVDPVEYPLLRWRWKVSNTLKGGDVFKKEGDDYPARIYVMFDYPLEKLAAGERRKLRMARALYDPNLPAATLCYVWDSKAPSGTITPSTYTDRVRMVVVESGPARVKRWVNVERDVYRDFKAAFGEAPPAISAIAVATDTDNTGESVTAWYGDISLHKRAVSDGAVPKTPAPGQ
ncbi:MAG: DUF3047 domain-containing protein [Pseudomonadota bacterium]